MNQIIILFFMMLFVPWIQPGTPVKDKPPVTYQAVKGKAILLGESITLLDENYKKIKDISDLNGNLVEITAVSQKYYKQKPTDNYCLEFKYVKIKVKGLEGIVNGLNLYELIKSTQNKTVVIENHKVGIFVTHDFGIGVDDDDGLTGCSINTPVWFSDEDTKYEGLISMVRNKYYKDDYPYFELKDDEGASDNIEKMEKKEGKYYVKIKRTYQEGGANLLLVISKKNNETFSAEIIESKHFDE